jgi:hypothetical protein
MNRAEALASLNKAFDDRFSKLFDNLSSNMASEDPAASTQHFSNGFALALDAYARAKAVIESKLPE